MTVNLADGGESVAPHRRGSWVRVLLVGLLFYLLTIAVLLLTHNPNLFPTMLLVGSFMVPAAYVSFFYERRHISRLSMPTTAMAFVYGGVLGVLGASILEPLLVPGTSLASFFVVGLIEELVKIVGVLVIARRRRHDAELDGLILGAAAGMGFAALESNGYGFSVFMASRGSLLATIQVLSLRAAIAPIGHGTWTAILAATLFRESDDRRYHLNMKVLLAYLLTVLLHGLWDGLPGLADRVMSPSLALAAGQLLIGAVGFVILWRVWREGTRRQLAQQDAMQE